MALLKPASHPLTLDRLHRLLQEAVSSGKPLPESVRGADLAVLLEALPADEAYALFLRVHAADKAVAAEMLSFLQAHHEKNILETLPAEVIAALVKDLSDDDAVSIFSNLPSERSQEIFLHLSRDQSERVSRLLCYPPESVGRRMISRYIALPPEMTAEEAIARIRALRDEMEDIEMVYYLYVVDWSGTLLGVLSMRQLLLAKPGATLQDLMTAQFVKAEAGEDQEAAARRMGRYGLMAVPVVDPAGRMVGLFTADDAMDVISEEATEDIQKMGGTGALGEPYLSVTLPRMVKKRAGWLTALFIGEMFTASAMAYFEEEIARAVVLALFVPLIISSGGNSGSQASTLVIRAMALGEVRLRDWWRVVWRELGTGFALGLILAVIGFARIMLWQSAFHLYGEHYFLVAVTVALSLVGVVMMGTLVGSSLPLLLRKMGLDPAAASAPFVATFVDVSGLVLYFSVAILLLSGKLI